jgi:N-acetylglucosamine-6-sulfatase
MRRNTSDRTAEGRISRARGGWLAAGLVGAALLAAPAGGGVAEAGAATVAKPNVVVVTTDDWTLRIASRMPNFRRLAGMGATFANAFVSYDLCCPARTTFLTGQYAHNHGVRSNFFLSRGGFKSFRTAGNSLPVWLQRAGYRTAFVGKYLNEYGSTAPREIPPGWNDWHGLIDYSTYNYFNWAINENGRVDYHGDRAYADALIAFARAGVQGRIRSVGDALAVMNATFKPVDYYGLARERDYQVDVVGRIADQALRRLIRAGAARPGGGSRTPFFLWYTPIAAHKEGDYERVAGLRPGPPQAVDPRPPTRYAHTYDAVGPPSDPSIDEADVSDKPATVSGRPRMSPDVITGIARNERGRLGAARAADDAIGRLLDTLRQAGQLDDTLFVYTTDQGYLQGQHRIPDNKYFAYEPGIHIPLVMAGPGVPRGQTVRDMVFNHDLAPTIVAAARARAGRVMDGLSLLPRLRGGRLARRDLALEALEPSLTFKIGVPVFDLQAPYYGVRTDRYKYVKWSFGDEELYDLRRDPYELENLAGIPADGALKARLAAEARRLRVCRGPACSRR